MPQHPGPRQLPLELSHQAASSREDLVVTPANAQAAGLVESWPDWPASVMVLVGPAGSGKSHLAAVWRELSGAAEISPVSIGAREIALAGERPLLIDDADRGRLDENGLFHLINAVRQADKHLLLTARRLPGAWGVHLPDLLSRLRAAATVSIEAPDDMLLTGVLTKLFADRQVEVEPHVIQYLVRRIERSLATAIEVVERLDRIALERKTRITRALAAETVGAAQGDFGI